VSVRGIIANGWMRRSEAEVDGRLVNFGGVGTLRIAPLIAAR
jgi:hypothetical protein